LGQQPWFSLSWRLCMRSSAEERYLSRVDRSGMDECWLWLGAKSASGYGTISIKDRTVTAHRFGYRLHFGSIPDGLLVCHSCDNRLCQNPNHWFLGTYLDNRRDADRKGRSARGETHGISRLTSTQVENIRRDYASGGVSQMTLAVRYGVSERTVGRVIHRKTWVHIP
jgi:hypothetical protein